MEGLEVAVKVKMIKVIHKDIFTVRYFFIEILENQIFNQNLFSGL